MKKKIVSLILTTTIMLNSGIVNAYAVTENTQNVNNLVIFIDFNDTNKFTGDDTKGAQLETIFNTLEDDNNDGISNNSNVSFKSYHYDVTGGDNVINTTFYPKDDDGIGYVSYKAPQSKEYYEAKTMGSSIEQQLLKDAFNSVKDEIELTGAQLDSNNDGKIDNVVFVFAGTPALGGASMLRPHKSTMPNNTATFDGKQLGNYFIVGEGSNNVNIYNGRTLGVISHEQLHMEGYPDLYNDADNNDLVGIWDLMGSNGITPQLPLVYSRNRYGNEGLNVKEINESGTYTLKSASILGSTEPVALKITSEEYPNEYFLIEYRKNDKKWDTVLPGSGIIVYRINNNLTGIHGNNTSHGVHVYVFRPGETGIDAGFGDVDKAFLSEESGRTTYGSVANSAFELDLNSIYYADGTNSNIVISEVGNTTGDEITFKVTLGELSEPITGTGTAQDPYKIKSSDHLKQMYLTPNKHFILENDIDLDGTTLNPIGDVDTPFSGTFDGQGHTIRNLEVVSDNLDVGFIGRLSTKGNIKNVDFENIDIQSNGSRVGGVVGFSEGTVENIKVTGNIEGRVQLSVGGVVGHSDYKAKVLNTQSNVNIVSTNPGSQWSKVTVGGIVGYSNCSLVENNYFNGTINAHSENKVGGIFGRNLISETGAGIGSTDNVFNITASGVTAGVGDLSMPQFGDTDEGTIGIELLKNIDLEAGQLSEDIVKYKEALKNGSHKIFSNNEAIAFVSGNKVQGVSGGVTEVIYELTLGANKIQEEVNVTVNGGIPSVDKTALQAEVEAGELLNSEDYTEVTYKVFETALSEAKLVLDDKDATQEEINNALDILIEAKKVLRLIGEKPVINAVDISLEIGEKFNPLDNVTATDKEDGDITSEIQVVNNTVDTTKAGDYEVTYKVVDSDNNETIITINVSVINNNAIHNIIAKEEVKQFEENQFNLSLGNNIDEIRVTYFWDENGFEKRFDEYYSVEESGKLVINRALKFAKNYRIEFTPIIKGKIQEKETKSIYLKVVEDKEGLIKSITGNNEANSTTIDKVGDAVVFKIETSLNVEKIRFTFTTSNNYTEQYSRQSSAKEVDGKLVWTIVRPLRTAIDTHKLIISAINGSIAVDSSNYEINIGR